MGTAVAAARQEWEAQRNQAVVEDEFIRRNLYDELGKNCCEWVQEATRAQEETLKTGLTQVADRVRQETDAVFDRCQNLNVETQHQCRMWIDDAVCRMEDIALTMRELVAAFAMAAPSELPLKGHVSATTMRADVETVAKEI